MERYFGWKNNKGSDIIAERSISKPTCISDITLNDHSLTLHVPDMGTISKLHKTKIKTKIIQYFIYITSQNNTICHHIRLAKHHQTNSTNRMSSTPDKIKPEPRLGLPEHCAHLDQQQSQGMDMEGGTVGGHLETEGSAVPPRNSQ